MPYKDPIGTVLELGDLVVITTYGSSTPICGSCRLGRIIEFIDHSDTGRGSWDKFIKVRMLTYNSRDKKFTIDRVESYREANRRIFKVPGNNVDIMVDLMGVVKELMKGNEDE